MQTEIFSKLKDPRVLGKVKHVLEDVLRIALIGVLCSCEDTDFLDFSSHIMELKFPRKSK